MERFLLKIFGNSPTIQTGVFGSETAGNIQYSEDPTTIQSLSAWSEGLGGATSNATKQPAINDIQGVFKVLSTAIKDNQVSGIPLYLSTETYQIGSIVLNIEENEPVLYYSLTANNTGNALTDDTNWANLYNYISLLISNNFVALDGSNAGFGNLSAEAKENIINTAWGGLQTTDPSKVGYIIEMKDNQITPTNNAYTLPAGGTWFINIICAGSGANYGIGSGGRIVAGGTAINVDNRTQTLEGFAIKIQ